MSNASTLESKLPGVSSQQEPAQATEAASSVNDESGITKLSDEDFEISAKTLDGKTFKVLITEKVIIRSTSRSNLQGRHSYS